MTRANDREWQIRTTVGPWLVSTMRLCGDHRHHGSGPAILYETMILGERNGTIEWPPYQARYCLQADAMTDHKRVVAALQAGTEPNDISGGSVT